MQTLLAALALTMLGGFAAMLLSRRARLSHALGAGSCILGVLIGAAGLAQILLGTQAPSLSLPWSVPYGSFSVAVDPLSAFFLLPVWLVSATSALYGAEYMRSYEKTRNTGASWFFFNTLVASMILLIIARDGILFLVAWEVMTIASFFLVGFEHDRQEVQAAGWLYLVASHLGTAFLFVLFLFLSGGGQSMRFDALHATGADAGVAFVLAMIGFGTKAGFLPLHVWLPEAHPAAPSHVSALMSGVMIKMGIYGLLRTLMLLGPMQGWWGYVLVGVGLTSGVVGVMFALAQHDLKRLLAYHSVENIGIIALGLGAGVIGVANNIPTLAVLGFAGGLLHVVNHAVFKSLLFLSAGSVLHATGTRNLEALGGLIRKMPATAAAFLVGAVAIVGLPPLNGFISEFLIYSGSLQTAFRSPLVIAGILAAVAAGLALIGGLAAACFAKAFGIVFLGMPRTDKGDHAHDPGMPMKAAMAILALACVAIGLLGPYALRAMTPVLESMTGLTTAWTAQEVDVSATILSRVVMVSAIAVGLALGLWALRARLLRGQTVRRGPTWDCGYAVPSARMQYTASSFAQPLMDVLGQLVRAKDEVHRPTGLFPTGGDYHSLARDPWKESVFAGLFRRTAGLLDRLHWIQQGKVQLYVLYVVVTLVALLLWKLD